MSPNNALQRTTLALAIGLLLSGCVVTSANHGNATGSSANADAAVVTAPLAADAAFTQLADAIWKAMQHQGSSVLNAGDLSILSFHATKVFNTFEGGAIICRDARTKQHIDHLKNFGFANEVTVVAAGINGKMSEFNAALGLLQLQHMPEVLAQRQRVDAQYREQLAGLRGIELPQCPADTQVNWSYFPIRVKPDFFMRRDDLYAALKANGVLGRRYFYPLISEFPMYRGLPSANPSQLPHATLASSEVICLPLYPGLSDADVRAICHCILTLARQAIPLVA
jgi:dTDP-4-amino-4,6-dideoxygalactose transaminase